MKLKQLLCGIDCKIYGNLNIEIGDIVDNSKLASKNCCFVAVVGGNIDGHKKCFEATKRGAIAVVVERRQKLAKTITQIVVQNTRQVLGILASNFYQNPSKSMKMIGITGTNGKTSTTYMIKHICEKNGMNAGVVGTNGCVWNNKCVLTGLTTPDPICLHKILKDMRDDGVKVVAMEVSAHALYFEKVAGIKFDASVFTNLTQDHLDFFKDMKNYLAAKKKLFTEQMSKCAIVCTNSKDGKIIAKNAKIEVKTFGNKKADFAISGLTTTALGQNFIVKHNNTKTKGTLPLFGEFNATNALGAIAATNQIGISTKNSILALGSLPPIDGRFNGYVCKNGALVVVDYAHTPDGLCNVLKTAKQIAKKRHGKLYSVFGCGGNRDATKRPIMGKISQHFAKLSIITSDNPRFEDPNTIINMITQHMKKKKFVAIENRKQAIGFAIDKLGKKDVLVVCGKGAENYMDICGQKIEYSDEQTIKEKIGVDAL